MAGLTYGYTYGQPNSPQYPEGVTFVSKINKWIVRVKRKRGLTTIAGYKTEEEARAHYNNYINQQDKV